MVIHISVAGMMEYIDHQLGASRSTQADHDQRATSSRNSYPTSTSNNSIPSRSVPPYTAQQLLNPKASQKSPQKKSSSVKRPQSPYFSVNDTTSGATYDMEEDESADGHGHGQRLLPLQGMSRNLMLESLHNVERRVEPAPKKVKRGSDELPNGTNAKSSYVHRSNGMVGEYMRPDPGSAQKIQPPVPKAVDLTEG